jgi:N-acetylneuraminic acid mutarotase
MTRRLKINHWYHLIVGLILCWCFFGACKKKEDAFLQGSWKRKADLPARGRISAAGISIGKKGYVGTGHALTLYYVYLNDWYEYDPATELWTRKADYPGGGIFDAVHLVINGKGYVGIGRIPTLPFFTTAFYEYDPIADTWLRKSDFPGQLRKGAIGFGVGNRGYVGLGSYVESFKDWWEYDQVTDTWTQKANYPGHDPVFTSGFVINDRIYVGQPFRVGGTAEWWQYDPARDKWSAKAPCPGPANYGYKGFSIGNNGYLVGGFYNVESWQYNAIADKWYQQPFYAERFMGFAFSIDEKGYHGTGVERNDDRKNDMWEFSLSR